ncbi:DUF5694 domain-containing protein [Brevundimonas nasdae]|uniref:TraB/GumN family protein n=1 Tax=Brevundimonas nasdae TaxID=172043 RepID=A0ABX8TLJ3_9CAUL|nr:DUF5694 domain-containing protein [Brevundimonas nasdae]QYC10907.1 hypothetical protein KWG56_02515 [Brevundimonas nasdae]QYC13694.1 hypothetical protein KWG63_16070 [Brevundimonas nasdae]
MFRILVAASALAVACFAPVAASAQSAPPSAAPEPVQVMIVGAFHFDNPGQDLNNVVVDPVTTPQKQAELEAVAEGLRRFRPTAVALERVAADKTTLLDQVYPSFQPSMLLTHADERYQIGYRLANLEGLSRVYAIDEQPEEGGRDYFPFEKVQAWFTARHREAEFATLNAPVAAYAAELSERQKHETLGQLLAEDSSPDHPISGNMDIYYGLLKFGDGAEQPGAELNAGWYERNAKIFTKLMAVARPGDRIVVVFGAGHGYWLRHFVQNTPGYQLVEAVPYLNPAP